MLTLVTYATRHDLKQKLEGLVPSNQMLKFVTPFPAKADALRTNWANRPFTDVLTLSRFTKDLFSLCPDRPAGPWRKSRLLLQLNSFRNLLPNLAQTDYGTFKTAYQAFSDLRAYTDAPEFPEELLAHFDENVSLMAQLFHQGCYRAAILDEHAGVFDLTARLRAPDGLELPDNATIVFDGFTFMTPAQLSFIEALSIRHQVIVPLPQHVFTNCHELDWPKALELSAHCVEHSTEIPAAQTLNVSFYPTGMMAAALRAWRSNIEGECQLVLGAKNPTEINLQEVPFNDAFQKQPVDVTAEARDVVFDRWEKRIATNPRLIDASDLLTWIEEDKKNVVEAKDMLRMREMSVLVLVEKAISDVPNCLAGQKLNTFLMSLLSEVVSLDAPRSSLIPLMKSKPKLHLYTLKNFHGINSSLPTALCLDGVFGGVKSDHRPFSPEMEKLLAKIGPVRRPELEFLFLQSELMELWPHSDLKLLIEDGLLKHDLGWKRLFENLKYSSTELDLKSISSNPNYDFFTKVDSVITIPEKLSASRLQDYLDCPRKYYADRIEKIIPRIESTLELEPMALGTIEHELVQKGWSKGMAYWANPGQLENDASKLVEQRDVLGRLNPTLKAAAVSEAALYARNGLERLASLERAIPGIEFKFEYEITAEGKTGFIDCLGLADGILILLDFKRSKGSNPSITAWEKDYPKIQLWFYLNALKAQNLLTENMKLGVGYLFFKEMDKSWLACSSELQPLIESKISKWADPWDDIQGALERYLAYESSAIARLKAEKKFLPEPKDSKVCDNCALRALCPKGGEEDEE